MKSTRPTLAEVRAINKRRERMLKLQASTTSLALVFQVLGAILVACGVFLGFDTVTHVGAVGIGVSIILALIVLQTTND